jgi:putative ABC transport system permease protein
MRPLGLGSEANMVCVLMALRGLSANKLRSFLTMLGVIIGVSAVIIAISIGQGSRAAVEESIQRLGTNVLTVRPGRQRVGNVRLEAGTRPDLKLEDAAAILRACPSIQRVSPQVDQSSQVKYKSRNTNVMINGTGKDYPLISNHPLWMGRYFTEQEVRSSRRVAVLGETTWKDLFDRETPINKRIRIGGQPFVVIGVLRPKGGQGFRNPDDAVYVPVATAMRRLFGMENIEALLCQARSAALLMRAEKELEAVLKKRHRPPNGGEPEFRVFNQFDLIETQSEQQDTFSALITYLAIVSLMVGGIGIMNIMLVSVTERTREIGIRMAVGAKRRDILAQFLLEAMFLSLVGGLIGVVTGIVGSNMVGEANQWKIILSIEAIVLAFGCSALVGIFFGFYPAWKASKLNPIEALRYE